MYRLEDTPVGIPQITVRREKDMGGGGLTHFQCKLGSSQFCSGFYSARDQEQKHWLRKLSEEQE